MRITGVFFFLAFCFCCLNASAQKITPLPHGMVYGIKPNDIAAVPASQIEKLMYRKTRFTTAIRGKVIRVTKSKGGWFEMDAGNGKIIQAHFKNYAVSIPTVLKGRIVIVEGVAQKQFIADDGQHLAGDTVTGKKQHAVNTNPKQRLTFEVRGLVVDK